MHKTVEFVINSVSEIVASLYFVCFSIVSACTCCQKKISILVIATLNLFLLILMFTNILIAVENLKWQWDQVFQNTLLYFA